MTKETMKCGWVSQAEDDIKQRKGEDNVAMLSLGRRLGTTASRLGTVLAEKEKKRWMGWSITPSISTSTSSTPATGLTKARSPTRTSSRADNGVKEYFSSVEHQDSCQLVDFLGPNLSYRLL